MEDVHYAFLLRRLATIVAIVILRLSLTTALLGVLLAFYYEPTAGGAYNSLKVIATTIPNGWLIQRIHNIAGNGVIAISLVEIVVMFLEEQFSPSWLIAWISGILSTLTEIALNTAWLLAF